LLRFGDALAEPQSILAINMFQMTEVALTHRKN
jgi:hypothetical protein